MSQRPLRLVRDPEPYPGLANPPSFDEFFAAESQALYRRMRLVTTMTVGKAGEVLVSATVRDAVAGKDIAFADHGVHGLKGLDGEFHLYDVLSGDGAARNLPMEPAEAGAPAG